MGLHSNLIQADNTCATILFDHRIKNLSRLKKHCRTTETLEQGRDLSLGCSFSRKNASTGVFSALERHRCTASLLARAIQDCLAIVSDWVSRTLAVLFATRRWFDYDAINYPCSSPFCSPKPNIWSIRCFHDETAHTAACRLDCARPVSLGQSQMT